ncbi:hypothetical protein HU200_045531 [Digitaria exilis]|uniref:Uncharacterized protein n=1 Tax=Digitaria exilis TaxID=1010633 RepID=A0A835B0W9_9POAL|nr:hypothetical protein HU200_045531 [Digitaria exilis]
MIIIAPYAPALWKKLHSMPFSPVCLVNGVGDP